MAVVNYLDDFLFIAFTIRECNRMMKQFLEICFIIGVPISKVKTVWATRWITFLGFLLNGAQFYLCILEEKRDKAVNNLNEVINKRKVTVKQIQSLAGLLNFLNRAIIPGRAFTRRMYSKYEGIVKKSDDKLKHYHHVKVDQEFKADCMMWLKFLDAQSYKKNVLMRPFIDLYSEGKDAQVLRFTSNASKNGDLGFGAWFEKQWTYAQWPKGFITNRIRV